MKKLKTNLIIITIIIISLFSLTACNNNKKALEHLERGRLFQKAREYEKAIDEFRTIYYKYGKTDYVNEAKALEKECETNIKVKGIFENGENLAQQKELEKSIETFEEIVTYYPASDYTTDAKKKIDEYIGLLFFKAKTLQESSQYTEAIKQYKSLIEKYPKSTHAAKAPQKINECEQRLAEYRSQKSKKTREEELAAEKERAKQREQEIQDALDF